RGGGDRCPRHDVDLSVDARLICVDLQEHIADAQPHALRTRGNDFDLPHVVDHRPRPPTAQRILSTAGRRVLLARRGGCPPTPAMCGTEGLSVGVRVTWVGSSFPFVRCPAAWGRALYRACEVR